MNGLTNLSTAWSSSFSMPVRKPLLLVVDDDRTTRAVLTEVLQTRGYKLLMAQNGKEALALLAKHANDIDAILLDRELPDVNGMELVLSIKRDVSLAAIPIIMLTGTNDQKKIQEGIDAGLHYYLVKPVQNELLTSVINSALREHEQKNILINQLHHHGAAMRAMDSCKMHIRTLREAEDTASLLAACFPKPEQVVVGLMELLVNAIEHGNLGVSYKEKHKLMAENIWYEELQHRAKLPENINKSVEVIYQRKDNNHLVQITDCGEGFDWKRYWHINPARATETHGRGIARARMMAFDRMQYNEKGNSITIMVEENDSQNKGYTW